MCGEEWIFGPYTFIVRVAIMACARTHWRVVATSCGAAALLAAAIFLPVRSWLAAFALWARGAGAAGMLAFALAQISCTLLALPAWPLRVAAGFVWGFAGGFALAMPSSLAGSVLAFVAGRRFLRERIAERVAREPRLRALDGAVAGGGFWMVLLLRLSPVFPNELVNYGLGLTRVRLGEYALASLLGMLPATATYVGAGSVVTAASELCRGRPALEGPASTAIGVVGLAATVAVTVASACIARRALRTGRDVSAPQPALAPSLGAETVKTT